MRLAFEQINIVLNALLRLVLAFLALYGLLAAWDVWANGSSAHGYLTGSLGASVFSLTLSIGLVMIWKEARDYRRGLRVFSELTAKPVYEKARKKRTRKARKK